MYAPVMRLLFVVIGSLLSYYSFQHGSKTAGYVALVGAALSVSGYFKNGTVVLAWKATQKDDFTKAEILIGKTRFPEWLKKEQRGYYHLVKALISVNKNHDDDAFVHFKEAMRFGVRTENSLAFVNLNLAEIELKRKNIAEAQHYVNAARALKHNKAIGEEIVKIENRIKTAY